MDRIWANKKFSDYLGENRALLDVYERNIPSSPTPTPSSSPVPPTPTNTQTPTLTPSPIGLFCVGQGFDFGPNTVEYYNGAYYVGGSFEFYNGNKAPLMAKIDANTGALANDFFSSIPFTQGNQGLLINDIEFISSGKFYAGGFYQLDTTFAGLNRFNSDGSVDPTFQIPAFMGNNINDIWVNSAETKVFAVGSFTTPTNRIVCYTNTGAYDTTFTGGTGFNNIVYTINGDNSGALYLGGLFTQYKGITRNRLIKIDENGTVDTTFMTGLGTGPNGTVTDIIIDGGYIYIAGLFTQINGNTLNRIAKIDAVTGVVDTAWGGNGFTVIGAVMSSLSMRKNPITNDLNVTISSAQNSTLFNFDGTDFYGKVCSISLSCTFVNSFGDPTNPLYGFTDQPQPLTQYIEEFGHNSVNGDILFVGDFFQFNDQYFPNIVLTDRNGVLKSTSNCFLPRLTPTPTPTPTQTVTPTKTNTPTPTPTPTFNAPLMFDVASGATKTDACNNLISGPTFKVYAQDLGNCGPCAPLTCWACLTTSQQVYSDIGLTTLVGDGYYANQMAPGNNASWYIVGGFPQGAGFAGC